MIAFKIESVVEVSFNIVVDNFSEDLFVALAPTFPPSKIISFDGDQVGGLVKIQLGIWPLTQIWISEIIERDSSSTQLEFVDKGIQVPAPLAEWKHRHVVRKISDKETMIIDDIECTTGFRLFDMVMKPFLKSMFSKRTPAYQAYFEKLV